MSNGGNTQSVITSEVEIKGVVKSAGSVNMDGKLEGDLVCSGDGYVGKNGSIKGNISANAVSIEGTVNGTITAKDKIEMKSTANINGDIKSKRLSVEDGVTLVGKVDVNPAGTASGKSDLGDAKSEPGKTSFLGKKTSSFPGT